MASPRARSSGSDSAGTTLGTVTGLADGGVYLELPRVAPGYQYGPALSAAGALAVGDDVLVSFVDDNPDTPVVIARVGGAVESPALVPVGGVIPYAGTTAPPNYLLALGGIYPQVDYPVLFAEIGTTYNIGPVAADHFAVPNLGGRVPVGADGGTYLLGGTGGAATHTLSNAEVPNVQGAFNNHGGESGSTMWQPTGAFSGSTTVGQYRTPPAVAGTAASSIQTLAFNNGGGGGAHNNMQPYRVLNYLIRAA